MIKLFAALFAGAFMLMQAPAFAQNAKKEEKKEMKAEAKKETKKETKKEEKKAKPKKGGC